ncbi:MAG: YmdB family metallophosphoesterase [Spirochaetaceae bacterium]|jgi:metallophosphoesterase (TIGR00282 family)|nr:YmdB family metallophosphoesterase [Spirochaetaceae bacterium]
MKILYIAEIVGKAGIYCVKNTLPALKKETGADAVIVCADAATNGSGLGRHHAAYLRKLGVNIITLGDQCFFKKDLVECMPSISYVLRPFNLNKEAPGIGAKVFTIQSANRAPQKLAVAVLLGQAHFVKIHADNPFACMPALLEKLRAETPFIVLDFHAIASAEKKTLFAMADGLCSAVIGSHTRVVTADAAVLPGGTAVITDAGRTGSQFSVGGNNAQARIQEYLSGIPDWTKEAWDGLETQGVLIDIAEDGTAGSITLVKARPPQIPAGPHAE